MPNSIRTLIVVCLLAASFDGFADSQNRIDVVLAPSNEGQCDFVSKPAIPSTSVPEKVEIVVHANVLNGEVASSKIELRVINPVDTKKIPRRFIREANQNIVQAITKEWRCSGSFSLSAKFSFQGSADQQAPL